MRRTSLLLLAGLSVPCWIVGFFGSGCGSEVETQRGNGGGGGSHVGPGGSTTSSGIIILDGGHHDAFDEYVDPGCPDTGPPIQDFSCDPFAQHNGDCGPGNGCYITVDYPREPCGQETYGSVCIPSGDGGQNAPCNSAQDCKSGFSCVVAGVGAPECVQLCHLNGPSGCPQGLLCEEIDVEGFGGCL